MNYKQIKTPKDTKIFKKNVQKSPDIDKLLPYYKLFKKRKEAKINKEDKKTSFLTEVGIKVNNNNNNYTSKEYDYDNTQDIVYTTANNELNIHKSLNDKRKKFDDLFGVNDIPHITTYDKIITQRSEDSKREKFKKIKSTNNIIVSVRDKFNDIINNEMKKLDILEEKLLSKSRKNIKK